ncbi:phosphatase PAP2 family protein [Gordonia sinesedis]
MSVDEAIGAPTPDDRRAVPAATPRADTDPDPDAATTVTPSTSTTAPDDEAEPAPRRDLTRVRRIAIAAWVAFMVYEIAVYGIAFDRTRLIVLLCLGLLATTIGRRRAITVLIDWAPFALVLLLYDWTRDIARIVNMPTQWLLAADVDQAMFGVIPTVWLQGHLKEASVPWWEIITSVVYMSYFVVPYAVAAVLWMRDRKAWRRYAACFVATTFLALIGYTLIPAAPPWAAARCTAAEVIDNPREAPCMETPQATTPGGLLGLPDTHQPGAAPYVERISARGWDYFNINAASTLVEIGQGKANLVAAIPSLHAGLTMLLALFMWPRLKALGRTIFLGYAFAMAFTLVYTAEHYVFDIILGWALAAAVIAAYRLIDARLARRRRGRAEPPGRSSDDAPTIGAVVER